MIDDVLTGGSGAGQQRSKLIRLLPLDVSSCTRLQLYCTAELPAPRAAKSERAKRQSRTLTRGVCIYITCRVGRQIHDENNAMNYLFLELEYA